MVSGFGYSGGRHPASGIRHQTLRMAEPATATSNRNQQPATLFNYLALYGKNYFRVFGIVGVDINVLMLQTGKGA